MSEFIDRLAAIDPSTRVGVGFAVVCVGVIMFILAMSKVRDWPARQPRVAPRSRRKPWYGVRQGQESAAAILRRLRVERERLLADPVGRPLAISARAWLDEAPTWPGMTA